MYKNELKYGEICTKNYYLRKKFNDLGITKKYTAYYFLLDIEDEIINKARTIKSFSKEIYPELALKYEKNDCSIERDIRNIISRLWDNGLKDKLTFLWTSDEKPTCCEFIYLLRNYVMNDIA